LSVDDIDSTAKTYNRSAAKLTEPITVFFFLRCYQLINDELFKFRCI
jgi:hypothetical protein